MAETCKELLHKYMSCVYETKHPCNTEYRNYWQCVMKKSDVGLDLKNKYITSLATGTNTQHCFNDFWEHNTKMFKLKEVVRESIAPIKNLERMFGQSPI